MDKRLKLFLMVAVSSLASQISLNMFQSGFILAMSPLMMMIFLYLFRDLNPFTACCWMALCSPMLRFVIELSKTGELEDTFVYVFPDVGFFFGFAIMFAFTLNKLDYTPYHRFYLRIIISDFFGNCCEHTLRVMAGLTTYSFKTFYTFGIIALVRGLIAILVLIAIDFYMSLLEKREHEENYKQLILMASTFESEVYSMRKNMTEIEDIMTNAFALYKDLDKDEYPPELRNTALLIAKDIHEVKKDYRRVIQGLQDNFLSDFTDDSRLSLSDLLKILSIDAERARTLDGLNISFNSSFETNYLIQKHFAFMSVLRNFISNSIDALSQMPQGYRGEIFLRARNMTKEDKAYCVIEIKDNGPGIPEDEKEYIFVPGYSTKFDEETGDINRGVGLTLAKDLITDQFDGYIELGSPPKGMMFYLWFPVDKLTERVNSYRNYSSSIASEDNVEQYEQVKKHTSDKEDMA